MGSMVKVWPGFITPTALFSACMGGDKGVNTHKWSVEDKGVNTHRWRVGYDQRTMLVLDSLE